MADVKPNPIEPVIHLGQEATCCAIGFEKGRECGELARVNGTLMALRVTLFFKAIVTLLK